LRKARLAFSISADGSLLGVIVEKSSPNLKKDGECMRLKALKWRFPPPHGIVTARYPISYSAS
jgi:outer membrane biosynthesis protein TonB